MTKLIEKQGMVNPSNFWNGQKRTLEIPLFLDQFTTTTCCIQKAAPGFGWRGLLWLRQEDLTEQGFTQVVGSTLFYSP